MSLELKRTIRKELVFAPAEFEKIETAAESADRPLAQWARHVLLMEADKQQQGESA